MTDNVAHIRKCDRKEQPLEEHLKGVAKLAGTFTSEIGMEKTGEIAGLLHDIGKASERFTTYLRSETGVYEEDMPEYGKYTKGEIDHSTAGAQYLDGKYSDFYKEDVDQLSLQMIELCILSHHSGLINCLKGDKDDYTKRISKSSDETAIDEVKHRIEDSLFREIDQCVEPGIRSLSNLIKVMYNDLDASLCPNDPKSLSKIKHKLWFRIGLLERFLLSCLIDADRIDSSSFERPDDETIEVKSSPTWETLQKRYEDHMPTLSSTTRVDNIRKSISEQCYAAASRPKGVYLLSVPTGGGKTLSSLRFALKHAKEHNLKRIFFIIPYTTIIDQNAKVVRDILEKDNPSEKIVLEHHSNLDPADDDVSENSQHGYWRLASENWDAKIIFTTMVQFMNSLFSSGTKSVRRMHNLANSVIIFDEVQTLPTKVVYMFNESVNFISKYCGSTIVLCTATQPLLNSNLLDHPIYLSGEPEIATGPELESLYEKLRRTDVIVEKSGNIVSYDYVSSLAKTKIEEYESVLIIVNTKGSAKQIHDILKQSIPRGVDLFHLSTNMCPAHRMEVLRSLKDNLDGKKRSICVSTQLIEAGVDIDFNVVIRSMAGIDSIAQAAGRCNRNGEMTGNGKVYLVNLGENIDALTDIYYGKDNAKRMLHKYSEDVNIIFTPEVMSEYFERYFYDRKRQMGYECKERSDSLFSLLSVNEKTLSNYYHKNNSLPKTKLRQSFKDANELFNVIEDATVAIIVPYNEEAKKTIADLCSGLPPELIKLLLRSAQKYSVNVFKKTFNDLLRVKAVKEIANSSGSSGIYCLVEGNYNKECGLDERAVPECINRW